MNIFVIPSWYPSIDHPMCGQFCLDQVEGLGEIYTDLNFGISIWGQQEESNLLWLKESINNIKKLLNFRKKKSYQNKIADNIVEIYSPALTWTRKVLSGNIEGIINANLDNLAIFQQSYGPVDLIHAHVAFPAGYVAMHLSEKFNIPFIITEHLDPFPTKYFMNSGGGLSKYIEKPLKNSAMVVAENKKLLKNIQNFGINRLACIPNMINEKLFRPPEFFKKNDQFTFLYIGDMIERKGIKYLLEAISLLDTSDKKFILCGTGENLEDYKKYSEQLGIDDSISWLEHLSRKEIVATFQHCDAFILPSLSENLGMVLLEAIACGKPIIATRCGGPEEIVNEKNGLLANVGDSRDLAEKIVWMIANRDNFDSEIIRQDFLDRFSRPVVSAKILQLYNTIINKSGSALENSKADNYF